MIVANNQSQTTSIKARWHLLGAVTHITLALLEDEAGRSQSPELSKTLFLKSKGLRVEYNEKTQSSIPTTTKNKYKNKIMMLHLHNMVSYQYSINFGRYLIVYCFYFLRQHLIV